MTSKLQYISQGKSPGDHLTNSKAALDAGCSWIQLRMKQQPEATVLQVAAEVKRCCEAYNAVFIVNDFVHVAHEVDAHGVHVGLSDMAVQAARQILGNGKIIGGTANTLEDVRKRIGEQCDYIGLGPFRFTTTKEKLSPILGTQGYKIIMQALAAEKATIPVYAIGGITADDLDTIMETGVHGVALSGVITNAADQKQLVQQLNEKLNGSVIYSR